MPSQPESPDLLPSSCSRAAFSARKQRWIDIGIYSLVGGFLGPRLSQALNDLVQSLCSPLEEFSATTFWAARTITLILLFVAIWRFISPKLEHFQHWTAWPPLLFCVPFGLWIFTIVGILHGGVFRQDGIVPFWGWLNIAISSTGFVAFAISRSNLPTLAAPISTKASGNKVSRALTDIPLKELKKWLGDEAPIGSGEQDMFSQEQRAKRMYESLLRPRNDASPNLLQTTVIEGPFGIGKTSLIKLIKLEAQRNQANIIFVDINCWGFSTLGAQEFVLEKIIEAIGDRFDALGMQQLPKAYAYALQESSGWIHGILEMLDQRSNDPVKILQRISPILEATDTYLVVVIEESDRNDHEFEQRKIEALLHRLRQVQRVTFILAASDKSQIDFAKVAEKIEPIPSLNPSVSAALFARMINEWGDPQVSGIIVPNVESTGKNSWSEDVSNPRLCVRTFAAMVRTPRTLKHVLREVDDAWHTLKGEVDLYDLLCVAILRHCLSPAFDFAVRHHRDFSTLAAKSEDEVSERLRFMKAEMIKVIENCDADPGHIRMIFERLFPHEVIPDFEPEDFEDILDAYITQNAPWPTYGLQTLKSSRSEIYWQRLLSKHVDDTWPKDQEVLRELINIQHTETIEHVANLCVNSLPYRHAVSQFSGVTISGNHEHARRFAAAVLDHAKPFRDHYRSSFNSAFLWVQDWLLNDVDGRAADSELVWYLQMLQKSLDVDMDDALCIYQIARDRMEAREQAKTLKNYMLNLLHAAWSPEGNHLSKKCRPGFNAVLLHILLEIVSDGNAETYLQDIPEWMVDLIMRDLREDTNHMSPLVYRVIRVEATSSRRLVKFDLEKTERLFKDRWNDALAIIAEKIEPQPNMNSAEIRHLGSLREAALEALTSAKVAFLAKSQTQEPSEAANLGDK